MINGYGGPSKQWAYAFGKVLGKPVADLDVLKATVAPDPGAPRSFRLDLFVDNLGDGKAPATSATLTLTRHGSHPTAIKTFDVPAIAHGANTERTVNFTIPSTPNAVSDYTVEIQLDSAHKLTEYDEADNRSTVPLP
jgi:subtilase family serine protease